MTDFRPGADDRNTPGAQGRAALLLVESLIHTLTSAGVLSAAQAVEVAEVARDVQLAIAEDSPAHTAEMRGALVVLNEVLASLKVDLAR